jgi:ferredoxin
VSESNGVTLRIIWKPVIPEPQTVDFPHGKTMLETLLDNKIRIPYACMMASCGRDLVRVHEGGELLAPPEEDEQWLLDRLNAPADHRLACQSVLREDASEGEVFVEPAGDGSARRAVRKP